MRKKILSISFVGLILATSLSACSNDSKSIADEPATTSFDSFSELTGPDREAKLLEEAKTENTLSIYTTESALEKYVPKFEEKYGLQVEIYRAADGPVLQRAAAEHDAGRSSFDIVGGSTATMSELDKKNALNEYNSPIRDAMPDNSKFEKSTANEFNGYAAIFNTSMIPAEELPSHILEYADPQFSGKLSMSTEDYQWYQALYGYLREQGVSKEKFESDFVKIANNSQKIKSHKEMLSLGQAGQNAVGVNNYLTYVTNEGDVGAPMASAIYEPAALRALVYALAADAKNPASATLFLDWLFTEGQTEVSKAGYIPANPSHVDGYESPIPADVPTLFIDQVVDTEQTASWQQAYKNLMEGRGEVLPKDAQ